MRAFWKRTLFLAAVGFAAGLLVGLGFLALSGIQAYLAQHGADGLVGYLLSGGLLGAVNMGSATIYSLEHWGVLRCTLTHFCVTMASVCAVGFSLGWLSAHDPATLWILAVCVAVYFVIWLVMSLRCKREIRKINAALKGWKDAQGDE